VIKLFSRNSGRPALCLQSDSTLNLLRISATLSLLGWAILHLFWDVSYRTFFWNQEWLGPIIENGLGMSWKNYVTDSNFEQLINGFQKWIGLVLLVASAVCFKQEKRLRKAWPLLGFGSLTVAWTGFLSFVDTGFQIFQFAEFALQISAPLFLLALLFDKISRDRLLVWMKATIALTFVSHGLFAMNVLPVPGHFIDMCINVLGVNESQARQMLFSAGLMDIFMSCALFIPSLQRPALLYLATWGILTSLARPVANIEQVGDLNSTAYWAAQFLCRAPHFLIPLAALTWISHSRQSEASAIPLFLSRESSNFRH
jgi:hypothetical protein